MIDKETGGFTSKSIVFYDEEWRPRKGPLVMDQFCVEHGTILFYVSRHKAFLDVMAPELERVEADVAPRPYVSPDTAEYRFGERVVRMASPFVMECVQAAGDTPLWTVRMHNYLYTPIEEREGRLYWGTAGMGGSFWCADLQTGAVIYEIKTKGTVCYAWQRDAVFFSDSKGRLARVDADAGTMTETLKLPGKMMAKQMLALGDGTIVTTTFERKNRRTYVARVRV